MAPVNDRQWIMRSRLIPWWAYLAMQIGCCLASAQFRFSTVFQSGMVLQSGAPIEVWGWGPAGWASALTLSLGEDSANVSLTATSNGTLWQARFEARTATASPLLLSLRDRDNATAQPLAQLSDVLIGMVLLVSGQSNVGISVSYSNQDDPAAEAENEAAADRLGTTVRLRAVAFADGDTPALELPDAPDCSLPSAQCGCLAWTRSNRSNVVGFSALGWYLARLAVEQLTAAGKVPVVGVIQSDVPGTPIQLWSRRETIKECTNATTYGPDNATTSRHYNAMIYPLIGAKIAVSAVVWYQGESNVGAAAAMEGAEYYRCALPAMITDWRGSFPKVSAEPLPFFVVELAAYCNEHDESTFRTFCDANTSALSAPDFHLPDMRVAQAAALALPNTYLVSAMDLGSLHPLPYESIHPTNKLEVARRVALGVGQAVFGAATVYRGPIPIRAKLTTPRTVAVDFNVQEGGSGLSLNTSAACPSVVLNVYCRRAQTLGFEVQIDDKWQAPLSVTVSTTQASTVVIELSSAQGGTPQRVRYAYSDWPVVSLRNARGGLPARLFDIAITA